MSMIPSIAENPAGLHQRYIVRKANGEEVDPRATYLVFRIDGYGRDPHHIAASRAAARAYCYAVGNFHEPGPLLNVARQLEQLLDTIDQREREQDQLTPTRISACCFACGAAVPHGHQVCNDCLPL